MPRNSSGSYSLPQAAFQANTVISSAAVNSNFSDIASTLTQSVATTGVSTITSPLKNPAGTSSAPGITFGAADPTSGLYLIAVGDLGIVSGSVGVAVNSLASYCSAAVVANAGGTNYAIGDRITMTGGTYLTPTILTVATLSGSAVATVTIATGGRYTSTPSNPVSQGSTTGSGSGATFTLTFASALLVSDLTGASLGQSLGATAYATNTILQLASAADLATAAGSAAVSSVFTRTGAVVATTGDYTEAQISFTDITTNNVSTTKHGYAPKAPNDATKYLDGTGAYSGPGGLISIVYYTSTQTVTIPSGASKAWIRLMGGGGGAAASGGNSGVGGGGAGLEKYLSGLTSGGTLALTVGAAGGTPGAGGNSSLASGTQTITTLTAGGGASGGGAVGAGGTATNGDINITGWTGGANPPSCCGPSPTANAGGPFFSQGNNSGAGGSNAAGKAGGCIIHWFS